MQTKPEDQMQMSDDRNDYGYPSYEDIDILVRVPGSITAAQFGAALAYMGLALGQPRVDADGHQVYPVQTLRQPPVLCTACDALGAARPALTMSDGTPLCSEHWMACQYGGAS